MDDMREQMRQDRLRHPHRPKMTVELRGAMRSALATMAGGHPWIPGAVFLISPDLAPWLQSAMEDALTEDEG